MDYISLIDRSRTRGRRSDVTPIFAVPAAFAAMVEDLAAPFHEEQIAQVAGLDALGFVIGTALALRLGAGFVPIRKGGKLPVDCDQEIVTDYSGAEKLLELRRAPFPVGARVLIADEWIETGAQVRAAIALLQRAGGEIAGIASVGFRRNEKTEALFSKYHCHGLWPLATEPKP